MTRDECDQSHLTPLDPIAESSSGKNAVCVYEPVRLAVKLDFIPIQFTLNNVPDDDTNFYMLDAWPFPDRHLLADGSSKALVIASLVVVDSDGAPEIEDGRVKVFQNDENVAGDIILGFEVETVGTFTYGDRRDQAAVTVPLEELTRGRTGDRPDAPNALLFTTTTNIGETGIIAELILHSHEDQYEASSISPAAYVLAADDDPFWLKPGEMVGSRTLSRQSPDGIDIAKLQWHLRRFGFVNYRTRTRGVTSNDSEWTNIRPIGRDGDFGGGTQQGVEDFQRVARTPLRNRRNNNVQVTFTQQVAPSVSEAVTQEIAVWCRQNYVVDQYHGRAWINHTDNTGSINEDATIHYGVLVVDGNPVGHLAVQNTIGDTRCLHGQHDFIYAQSVRSAIRLFLENNHVFRLHDADPNDLLSSARLYTTLRDEVIELLGDIRRLQRADYSAGTNRDVGIHRGYRTFQEQQVYFQAGTGAAPGFSWHNYGLAMDIVFFNSRGQFAWCQTYNADNVTCAVGWDWNPIGNLSVQHGLHWGGNWTDPDRPHHQLPNTNPPSQAVRDTYNNSQGTIEQKLQAVWNLLYPAT